MEDVDALSPAPVSNSEDEGSEGRLEVWHLATKEELTAAVRHAGGGVGRTIIILEKKVEERTKQEKGETETFALINGLFLQTGRKRR